MKDEQLRKQTTKKKYFFAIDFLNACSRKSALLIYIEKNQHSWNTLLPS